MGGSFICLCGRGSKSCTPSEHPNPTTKIGGRMGGEFTYQPKSDPKTVLTTTAMVSILRSFVDVFGLAGHGLLLLQAQNAPGAFALLAVKHCFDPK